MSNDDNKLTEVKVRILAFPYYVNVYDPLADKEVRAERIGTRDEVIQVNDRDLERGRRHDAFYATADEPEGVEEFDPAGASDAELSEWIRDDKPSVKVLVEASGGDPDLARRLLAAEEEATGGDSRKTAVEALGAIIANA